MNLRFVSLVSLAVVGCVAAQAGSWGAPSYAGGSRTMSQTKSTLPYAVSSNGAYGGGGNVCGGPITVTFKWNASSSADLPPATVYVLETCSASGTDMGNTGACGTADNGLASGNNTKNTSSVVWYGSTYAQGSSNSTGTRLTKWDSSSGKVTVTASPSAAGDIWPSTVGSGLPMPGASVSYSAQIVTRAIDIHRTDGGQESLGNDGFTHGLTIFSWTGTDILGFLYSEPGPTVTPLTAKVLGPVSVFSTAAWSGLTRPAGDTSVWNYTNLDGTVTSFSANDLMPFCPLSASKTSSCTFTENDTLYGTLAGVYVWDLRRIYDDYVESSLKYRDAIDIDFGPCHLNDNIGFQLSNVSATGYDFKQVTEFSVKADASLTLPPLAKDYIGDPKIEASFGQTTTIHVTAAQIQTWAATLTDGQGPGWYDVRLQHSYKEHSGTCNVYNRLGLLCNIPTTWSPLSENGPIILYAVWKQGEDGDN